MITQNKKVLINLPEATAKKLTSIVSETLALEMTPTKTFTVADLWNIQRKKRSTLQRRHG